MDINNFTQRSQEAILAAKTNAERINNQYAQPEHLLEGLLSQTDGILYPLLAKLGVHVSDIRGPLERAIERIPTIVGGGEVTYSPETVAVLEEANAQREALKDSYVSVEHIILSLADSKTSAGEILREAGLTRAAVLSGLAEVRGAQRITSQNPEDTFAPLEQYGRNLTEDARNGKLDPVIGRDEEIRRVIQVLSRRTMN